jgi:sulfate adenylyltransferase large subunit
MKKEPLKIVIVGHVDHGKSTLIGRLLLDTNSLPKDKLAEIKRISKELGKDTEIAYVTDQLKEEREKNITIDTTQIFFKTSKRNYVIIDAPGHVEFLKNMISGATHAEAVVLIVDTEEGIQEQTRRHSYLINMLGINRLIVGFNKMDLVDYSRDRYQEVKDELLTFLKKMNIEPINTIPISAKTGSNVYNKTSEMNWYRGPTLLKALDSIEAISDRADKPLRLPIQDTYQIDGETIAVGRISSGIIKKGQTVVLLPSSEEAVIKNIKVYKQDKKSAEKDENIGITFENSISIKRGDIITQKENTPEPAHSFTGNLFWMSDESLEINKPVTLRCATQEVEATVEKIEKRINSSTLEIIEENAKVLKVNESGIVSFRTKQPILVEKFNIIEELGRFVVEHDYNLKGTGIIT